jgi:hypothetical protein
MRRVEDAATVESVARGNRLVPRSEKDGEIWERGEIECGFLCLVKSLLLW